MNPSPGSEMNEHSGAPAKDPLESFTENDQRLLDEAQRALAERPRISISFRIGLSMLLNFFLVASAIVASITLITMVGTSEEFLEKVNSYLFETEHARRFEKNYLLYGSNLDDAITQVQTAHQLLRSMKENVVDLVGLKTFQEIEDNLDQYGIFLEKLNAIDEDRSLFPSMDRVQIERELRRMGAQMLADATALAEKEKLHLRIMIRTSWLVAAGSLFFIMIVMFFVSYLLQRQIARPLRRFVEYTHRIASGDYSPITPSKKYRDEFSHLAIAANSMLLQLKQREIQLARTSRMVAVGTLTAGIAHELNNPLNNIGLNAEALLEGLSSYPDEQKEKMLVDIMDQVERASATVRNLLDFTRIEKPIFVAIDLAKVIAEARRLLSNEAELADVEFEVQLPPNMSRIHGNPRDLQQVFLNLFLNAIQAMPDGGTISVLSSPAPEGFIRIEVTDTGTGIPAEQFGSIFDPFFTTKEVGGGTGLGLFVTYGIVGKHHGQLEVQSRVGKGTTFTVTIPIISPSEKES